MTAHLTGSGVTLDSREEQARKAVKAFRALQPTLSAYARVLTRRSDVRVELAADMNAATDGKRIFIRPPMALGDATAHNRNLCDKRDANLQNLCAACRTREGVLVSVYHEIAHIAFDSFVQPSEYDIAKLIKEAVGSLDSTFAKKLKARIDAAPPYSTNTYMKLSGIVSPFLPVIYNALDDARINSAQFRARQGTKIMFDADMWAVFTKGFEAKDPNTGQTITVHWTEQPQNQQFMVGLFCKASGYDYSSWFIPPVVAALDDEEITRLTNSLATVRSAGSVYQLTFPILARARELGFCLEPEKEEEPEDEESSSGGSDPSESESEPQPESDDSDKEGSDGGSGDDDSGNKEKSGGDSGESDPESDDDGDDSPGSGDRDGDAGSGVESEESEEGDIPSETPSEADDPDEGDSETGEGSPGGDSPGGVPSSSGEGVDDDVSEPEQDASGSSGAADSSPSMGSGEPSSVDARDDEPSRVPGSNESESRDDLDSLDSKDSLGDDEPSSDIRDDDESDDSDEVDDTTGDDPGRDGGESESTGDVMGGVDSSSAGQAAPGEASESNPNRTEFGEAVDESELLESGADDGTGGTEIIENEAYDDVPMGTAEESEAGLKHWQHHGPKPIEIVEQENADAEIIDRAIVQGIYFETPSRNIYGVREHRYGEPIIIDGYNFSAGWSESDEDRYGFALGRTGDFETPESMLGGSLLKMRAAFQENARGATARHRTSGKVDGRVLGKRAYTGDERLFKKKSLPGKRDYFVEIVLDISGSTAGDNLDLIKRACFAQATLLHRMGIKFAIVAATAMAHMARGGRSSGIDLDIYHIKEAHEPWAKDTQKRLSEIGAVAANLDGHNLEFARKVCDRQTETDKIILYFSDGKMPAENHDEELEILQREIRNCRQRGYTLLGVGIRTDSPARHGLETVEINSVDDLGLVVKQLGRHLAAKR